MVLRKRPTKQGPAAVEPPASQAVNKSHDIDGLPDGGLLRVRQIVAPHGPIPVSRSTWWAGVKDGRFPQPVKLGPSTTAWRVADIRELIEKGCLDGRA